MKPIIVTETIGSTTASVKIYTRTSKGYTSHAINYWLNGKRHREFPSDLEAAKKRAGAIATSLCKNELQILKLKDSDSLAYVRSIDLLKPTGLSLDSAVTQFVDALKILGNGSLVEAVEFYKKHNAKKIIEKPLNALVEDFIAIKRQDGKSAVYIRSLEFYLGKFRQSFPGYTVNRIDSSLVDTYLRGLKGSGRSRNNFRGAILTLLKFAKSKHYLSSDAVKADAVGEATVKDSPIEVFAASELEELLAMADSDLLPFMAIAAFTGCRHAEITRLDWRDIRFKSGFLKVEAEKAKTAGTRLIPIQDCLREWLAPYAKDSGRICPELDMTKRVYKLLTKVNKGKAAKDKIKWKHNGLRHSYASYRVAQIADLPRVALELGNSVAMILKHYREVVEPDEATKWFAVKPDEKILRIAV